MDHEQLKEQVSVFVDRCLLNAYRRRKLEGLASLFPAGWQRMAWQSGAVERLRGFPSPDVLLRMLMLHVVRGYSLREPVVRTKLANWTDTSDVAFLKRLRNSPQFAN